MIGRESDCSIVPMKRGNACGGKGSSSIIALAEETCTTRRGREGMGTQLARITEIAKTRPKEPFTSLYHLLNVDLLRVCHHELDGDKAAGVDGVTKAMYEENLDDNLLDLESRLANMTYIPQPVRRVFIKKDDGKSVRPLGIPSHEDKIVQLALKKILEPIFEEIFLSSSYGFRPGMSCHDALKALSAAIENGRISFVVDADIRVITSL